MISSVTLVAVADSPAKSLIVICRKQRRNVETVIFKWVSRKVEIPRTDVTNSESLMCIQLPLLIFNRCDCSDYICRRLRRPVATKALGLIYYDNYNYERQSFCSCDFKDNMVCRFYCPCLYGLSLLILQVTMILLSTKNF